MIKLTSIRPMKKVLIFILVAVIVAGVSYFVYFAKGGPIHEELLRIRSKVQQEIQKATQEEKELNPAGYYKDKAFKYFEHIRVLWKSKFLTVTILLLITSQ